MKNNQIATLMVIILALQFIPSSLVSTSQAQTSSDVYVGIDITYGDVTEVKALIDQVSSYTNLVVIGTSKVSFYPGKLIETLQYAFDNDLSFISLTPSVPEWTSESSTEYPFSPLNRTEWFKYAREKWGDRLLGFYEDDEPGGKILDRVRTLASNESIVIDNYADAAEQYNSRLSNKLDFVKTQTIEGSGYPIVTSDYGLYWFDYKAGYDIVFAELGWNYSRQLNVALCRGAATAHNKDWGAIITWTYTNPPYIESGKELYNDLVLAYENGAKYLVVFDGNEGWTGGILQQEHLDALKQFWDYVQTNPRQKNPVSERTGYVLPDAYGYGFRGPNDHIWGIWEADDLTPNITTSVASLLADYVENLDILYEDGLHPENDIGYDQLFYWHSYTLPPPRITILSPENTTYDANNVTLTFTINELATWIGYSLDNQGQVRITENTTLLNLPVGPHNITLYARDEAKTMGASETINFNINPPEHFPLILVVVVFSIVAAGVVAVAASAYLKKARGISTALEKCSVSSTHVYYLAQ